MQLGGHADDESNVINVALREAEEESGIKNIRPFDKKIFDIDAHLIPENPKKMEPEHKHYEIRYLLVAPDTNFSISEESNDLKWFSLDEIEKMKWDDSITRMVEKWKMLLKKRGPCTHRRHHSLGLYSLGLLLPIDYLVANGAMSQKVLTFTSYLFS
jgi:8-oxo-dGTP pyrophosphatase MutT (NUDIX family)